MTLRVDIEKDLYENIQFPPCCPVCGTESPDSLINMRTYININQPLNEPIGAHWNFEVPVCQHHKKQIIFGRLLTGLIFVVLTAIIAAVLLLLLPWLEDSGWLVFTVLLIAMIAFVMFLHSKIYTAPILIESFSYRLIFTFKSDELAKRFARLNGIDKLHTVMNQTVDLSDSEGQ